jgi:hypothetical protein
MSIWYFLSGQSGFRIILSRFYNKFRKIIKSNQSVSSIKIASVGCLSVASCTFWDVMSVFLKFGSECRVPKRSVMHLLKCGGWRRKKTRLIHPTLHLEMWWMAAQKDAPYPPYASLNAPFEMWWMAAQNYAPYPPYASLIHPTLHLASVGCISIASCTF